MPRETKYPTNSYNLWQSFTNSRYCIPNKIPQLNASHSIRPCLGSTLTNHKLQFLQTPLNWQRFQEASPGSLVKANGFGKVKHHQNWAIHRTHMILSKESWFQRSFQDTESHKCAWVRSRFANYLHLKYPTPANSTTSTDFLRVQHTEAKSNPARDTNLKEVKKCAKQLTDIWQHVGL